MCQCVCCSCWWVNLCGVCCGGLHSAYCCASCWMCQPQDLFAMSGDCCICCFCTGIGGNTCCYGSVCCAPQYLVIWSDQRNLMGSGMGMGLGMNMMSPKQQIIIINSPGPNYGGGYMNQGYYDQGYNQGFNQGYNLGYGNYNPNGAQIIIKQY